MVAGSRGSSLIARDQYIRRLLNKIESLQDENEILKERVTSIEQEKSELERAGVGPAVTTTEGGDGSGRSTSGGVSVSGSVDHDSVSDNTIAVQDLISNSPADKEGYKFLDLKVRINIHGKEIHVWRTVLSFMRDCALNFPGMQFFVSGVQLVDRGDHT